MIPQLILTLSPAGDLLVELPGVNGSRRQIPVTNLSTLQTILQAQLRHQTNIGLDGAPTARQVLHWEKHTIRRDNCPFCRAEAAKTKINSKAKTRTKIKTRTSGAGNRVRSGPGLTNKVLIPDPEGKSLLPIMVTRKEARKLGWKPPPKPPVLVTNLSPEDLGI